MDLSALSPSRINTFKDCELKYFLQYHLRLPESRESNIYGEKGTAGHECLEFYGNHIRVQRDPSLAGELEGKINSDYVQVLKDYYAKTELWKLDDREGMRGGKPKGWPHPVEKNCEACPWATKDGICEIANKPFKIVEGCPRPNFEDDLAIVDWTINTKEYPIFENEIIGTEVEFHLTLEGGVEVRGVIDLVVKIDDNTIEIIDYKTGNSTKSYNAALTDPQMRIYSMVAKLLWPDFDTYITTLYYVRKKRMVTCVFSKDDDKGTFKATARHWSNIKANDEPYRPQRPFWLCNFCVGHDTCGKIKDKFKDKRGRFILPTIECAYKGIPFKGDCWGGLSAENPDSVTADNVDKMTYACSGHKEIHKGGEYVPEPDGGETIR